MKVDICLKSLNFLKRLQRVSVSFAVKKLFIYFLLFQFFCNTAFANSFPYLLQNKNSLKELETLVPSTEKMFELSPEQLVQHPNELPQDLVNNLESQVQLSAQTILETFFLNSGLYLTFKEQERRYGRDILVQRLLEKVDTKSVKYEVDGVGKAELILLGRGQNQIPISMIRLNSGRYVLILDRSMYNPDSFNSEVPNHLPPERIELELKLRSIVKSLVHGLVSELLIFGKKGGDHIPLYKMNNLENTDEPIRADLIQGIESLSERYLQIEDQLSLIETSDRDYERLIAERELIEENIIRLQNNPNSFWGKLAQVGAKNLSETESLIGQPVTIIYHNKGQFEASENIERPNTDNFKNRIHKWSTYSQSMHESIHIDWETWHTQKGAKKLKIFSKGDLYFQFINLPWQIILAGVSGLVLTFLPNEAPNWSALMWNALVIGLVVGVNIRTFMKWSLSGSELSKSAKDTFMGILFALTAYMFDPSKTIADMGLIAWGTLIGSQVLKNFVKKGPREYQAFKRRSGQTAGEYSTPVERYFIDWRSNSTVKPPLSIEVKLPFKLLKKVLENTVGLRTELVSEIPREIKKESILSTEMVIKTYVSKMLSTYSWVGMLEYLRIGPYWEYRSVLDKEAFAIAYAKEHGEYTPKARDYFKEAKLAREKWENYKLVDENTIMNVSRIYQSIRPIRATIAGLGSIFGYQLDERTFISLAAMSQGSKVFHYGVSVPSQYVGYYFDIAKSAFKKTYNFFKDKPPHKRFYDRLARTYFNFKINQKVKAIRSRNIINMNYSTERASPEQNVQRREKFFAPLTCMGYFR